MRCPACAPPLTPAEQLENLREEIQRRDRSEAFNDGCRIGRDTERAARRRFWLNLGALVFLGACVVTIAQSARE